MGVTVLVTTASVYLPGQTQWAVVPFQTDPNPPIPLEDAPPTFPGWEPEPPRMPKKTIYVPI